MKDEIKEIKFIEYNGIEGYIELMKHDVEPLNNPECKSIWLYYDGKDIKALLDYITNLQQENEKLKLDVKYWENKWQNTRFANNQVKVLQDTIIKSANNTNKSMEQTEIYKSRCEKAIEYIKENYPTSTINYQDDKYKLINILNGSDENETNS